MQLSIYSGEPTVAAVDLVIVALASGDAKRQPIVKRLDAALGGALTAAIVEEGFKGNGKQKLVLNTLGKLRSKRVALVGLGKEDERLPASLLSLGGTATRLARDVAAKEALVLLPKLSLDASEQVRLVSRGALLGGYSFDRYKSEKGKKLSLTKLSLGFLERTPSVEKDAIRWAQVVGEAVQMARDLVNEPAIELYPESFADRARQVATRGKLKVKVLGPTDLKRLGMRLILGVGAGSSHPPRLVHISYTPAGAKGGPVVLVGKGITFDSGGLSLKSPGNMEDMKVDMSGAAAVLATLHAVSQLKPKVAVHGILALAENMPSGSAIRPGDVIKSARGKTVEINNTDAEGRLVLADALHFAQSLKPARIVDLATLTGACVVALGPHTVGLFSNDDKLAAGLQASASNVGEHFWRMPLTSMLKEQLKSDVADMKNTGSREGGAITAALFLSEFVGDTAWAHLDIAGPATSKQDNGALSKGGTGVAVATLVDWLT